MFFNPSGKIQVFINLFAFFYSVVRRNGKIPWIVRYFFLYIGTRFGLLFRIQWIVCVRKSQRIFRVSFSRTGSGLCIYHLEVWSNFNLLHNFQWINISTQLCLVLHSFLAILLYSFMGLTVSPLHLSQYFLFGYVLSILAWLKASFS